MHVGIFMHTNYFEDFFVKGLGLNEEEYVNSYHNDFSFDYARLLQTKGIRTTIYNFTRTGNTVRTYQHGVVDCTIKFIPVGLLYKGYLAIPFSHRTPIGKFISQYISTVNSDLTDILRSDGISVIYAQEYASGRFERLAGAARKLGIPIIAAYHGGSIHKWILPIKKRTLHRAAFMTTLNEDEQRSMVQHFPRLAERIRLLPNFVNSAVFYPRERTEAVAAAGLDPECRYLITVGRLFEHQKGHSLLVEAAEQLKRYSELRILIAGGGPDEHSLKELIKEKGLEDRIILLGTIRDKEMLARYYNASELFVLPSRYEGLPLVILEAGACGLPTVAFNVMGVRGLVRHGVSGLLAEDLAPGKLAAALEMLLENPALCREMGEAALRIVRSEYSEEIIGARLYNLLQESLGLAVSPPVYSDGYAPEASARL
ncbi:glycosyltransferase family 4 protein [Paenibacillus sp. MMS20-IR301]|uniref:glycosyltransferase family 4 protein n=1 Tax=Paenibacillus sp. MMS20-IR301 TaxID=2895946 RepID=UPI0028EA00D5|nr:glycosyltransferase family 4 protein [Paenibacillus sp. MMS20-IR301]WNS40961.1 glycosyltransferase family 4 protein [Paenibacillus sp. MMS20-IR301]